MDYEYYYNNARSRYYNACSEINSCENRINELRIQKRQKNNQINRLTTDIKDNQEAFDGMGEIIKSDTDLSEKFSKITVNTNLAAINFSGMVSASDVVNKNLNDVFNNETTNTKSTLNNILETLRTRKNALGTRGAELQNELRRVESDLQDIENKIRTTESNLQDWRRIKTNASIDMEYYRRKMNEAL